MEALIESGLVEGRGQTRARTYHLGARVYNLLNQKAAYTRQAGFSVLQQEQMVLNFVGSHGEIRRQDVIELCQMTPDQATRLLKRLVEAGQLTKSGANKGAFHTLSVGPLR